MRGPRVKLIRKRDLPKRESRDEWESLGASEKSGTLQKRRRVWKNTLRRSENWEKREEDSPENQEKVREEVQRRIPKEAQEICENIRIQKEWSRSSEDIGGDEMDQTRKGTEKGESFWKDGPAN